MDPADAAALQADPAAQATASLASIALTGDPLLEAITAAVRAHMARYDGSHDFSHIRRVVGLAAYIAAQEEQARGPTAPALDRRLLTLIALLHDVGDRKYLDLASADAVDTDAETAKAAAADAALFADPGARAIAAVLHRCGAPDPLRRLVPVLCQHVSWSAETKTAASAAIVAAAIVAHPELAVVQDADRLDSIGAVGIGRVFAYGGARGGRTLQASLDHFDEKLLHVHTRMKTATGKRLAQERTDRLRVFLDWFREEAATAIEDPLLASVKAP